MVMGVPHRRSSEAEINAWLARYAPFTDVIDEMISLVIRGHGPPTDVAGPDFVAFNESGAKIRHTASWLVAGHSHGFTFDIFGRWAQFEARFTGRSVTVRISELTPDEARRTLRLALLTAGFLEGLKFPLGPGGIAW